MAAKKSSVRALLAKRRPKEEPYLLSIADDTAARARLAEAKQKALWSGIGKDEDDPAKAAARKELEAAQAELDACYEPLRLRAMRGDAYEALLAEHPPTDGSDKPWNQATFAPALVAACAVDSDLTAEEWAAELAGWSVGEQNAVFKLAVNVNIRPVNEGLGKD